MPHCGLCTSFMQLTLPQQGLALLQNIPGFRIFPASQ
jgi:hypothetical protein